MQTETIPQGDVSTPDTDEALASAAFGEEGASPEAQESDVQAAEPAQDDQGDTPAETPDESEGSIEYLDQLAAELEIDPEQLMGIKVKIKVDGEERDATLKDLVKVNQLEGHVNKKSIELSEQRKAFDTEAAKLRTEWQQRVQFASQVINGQEAQLQQQFQQIDWNTLAQQDPAQYSALYLQFQQAGQQVQAQKAALQQHWQQQQAQMREAARPKALEAIRTRYPELADPITYGNAVNEVKSYLKGIGADEASMQAVELDPLVFQVARDAARYAAIASRQPGIKAKLKTAPKMAKPGARDSFGTKTAALNALRKRADQGDEAAVAELLFAS